MKQNDIERVTRMTIPYSQFKQELNGELGLKYKKWAESKMEGLRKQFEEGKIRLDQDGAAYWSESGNYLDGDVCQVLSYAGCICDDSECFEKVVHVGVDCYEKTVMAREKQLRKGNEVMDMPRASRILDDIEAYAMKRLSGTEDTTERIRIASEMSVLQRTLFESDKAFREDGISFFNISLLRTFAKAYDYAKWMVGKLAEAQEPVLAAV